MYVYAEHCLLSGRAVPARVLDATDDADNCADFQWIDRETAEYWQDNEAEAPVGSWRWRAARAVRGGE
jgi:hypothetical protein